MKHFYFFLNAALIAWLLSTPLVQAQTKSTFEELLTDPSTYWNGQTSSYGSYRSTVRDSNLVFFNSFSRNNYGWGLSESWSGMAYSRMQDDTTAGYTNQYSAITAGGALGSENYATFYVGMSPVYVALTKSSTLDSVYITNATYTYLSMREGDMFSKQFGGTTGDDPDSLVLIIRGIKNGSYTDSVYFYLADYTDANPNNDYLVDEWAKVELTPLGEVDSLEMDLISSDMGVWGMRTPAYFCMDNLGGATFDTLPYTSGDYWNGKSACFGSYTTSFTNGLARFSNHFAINDYGWGAAETFTGFAYSNMEDALTPGYNNQYSAYPAAGANGSYNYALCNNYNGTDTLKLNEAITVSGAFITNGTYAVLSMQQGDMFAKKFGGESGNDPDWFLLTVQGLNAGIVSDTVEFYLADFRFADNSLDYIVTDWEFVDFSALGNVDQLVFSLSSSDAGMFGMNTPAYFFLDDFNDWGPVVVSPIADIEVDTNAATQIIDLSGTFTDPDDNNALISLHIADNKNSNLVMASLNGTELSLSFARNASGSSEIIVEALSNGQQVTDTFTVSVSPALELYNHRLASVAVYPNPTSESIHLTGLQAGNCQLTLMNSMGQVVLHQEITANTATINLESYPAGVYHLMISDENEHICQQIIKQ